MKFGELIKGYAHVPESLDAVRDCVMEWCYAMDSAFRGQGLVDEDPAAHGGPDDGRFSGEYGYAICTMEADGDPWCEMAVLFTKMSLYTGWCYTFDVMSSTLEDNCCKLKHPYRQMRMYEKFFSMGVVGPQVVYDGWYFDFQEATFRSVPVLPDNERDADSWRGPYIDYMLATLFNPELPVPCWLSDPEEFRLPEIHCERVRHMLYSAKVAIDSHKTAAQPMFTRVPRYTDLGAAFDRCIRAEASVHYRKLWRAAFH